MKTIEPINVWYNGQQVQATLLSASAQNDNLLNSATFQYQLLYVQKSPDGVNEYQIPIVTSYLTMTGTDYDNWETNDYAYNWIAQQLNINIIN